jgi:thiol-disulfide isomerase/thioredoxin
MTRWPSAALLTASLLGSAAVPKLQAQEQIGIAIGATPAAVVLEDLDGNPVDLADYIGGGKPLLLELWATWCPLCKALEPRMDAAYARYGDQVQFFVVAVAVNQSKRRVRRHVERHALPGRVLWDTEGRAVRAFMAPSTSYVVVLDGEGRVAYTGVGEDQDLEAALESVLKRQSSRRDDTGAM